MGIPVRLVSPFGTPRDGGKPELALPEPYSHRLVSGAPIRMKECKAHNYFE